MLCCTGLKATSSSSGIFHMILFGVTSAQRERYALGLCRVRTLLRTSLHPLRNSSHAFEARNTHPLRTALPASLYLVTYIVARFVTHLVTHSRRLQVVCRPASRCCRAEKRLREAQRGAESAEVHIDPQRALGGSESVRERQRAAWLRAIADGKAPVWQQYAAFAVCRSAAGSRAARFAFCVGSSLMTNHVTCCITRHVSDYVFKIRTRVFHVTCTYIR